MAVVFTLVALASALILKDYEVDEDEKYVSHSFVSYSPLMLWIFLDSSLFETLSRHEGLMIWSSFTYTIIAFHLLGLVLACFIKMKKLYKHLFIAVLFFLSYLSAYLQWPLVLAMIYPFTISYYNVVVFTVLSKEMHLSKLAYMMVFIGWIASGLGLALALSKVFH
jgi:hypothetical protein